MASFKIYCFRVFKAGNKRTELAQSNNFLSLLIKKHTAPFCTITWHTYCFRYSQGVEQGSDASEVQSRARRSENEPKKFIKGLKGGVRVRKERPFCIFHWLPFRNLSSFEARRTSLTCTSLFSCVVVKLKRYTL